MFQSFNSKSDFQYLVFAVVMLIMLMSYACKRKSNISMIFSWLFGRLGTKLIFTSYPHLKLPCAWVLWMKKLRSPLLRKQLWKFKKKKNWSRWGLWWFAWHRLSPLAAFTSGAYFFTMEGGDSEFANFTLPTLKAYLEACSHNVSGNKQ